MDSIEQKKYEDAILEYKELCYHFLNSYTSLKDKFELLYSTVLNVNPGIIPLEIDPYKEDERALRETLPPTHWDYERLA